MKYFFYLACLTIYSVTMLALSAGTGYSRDYCPSDEGTIYYTTSGGTGTREPCPRTVTEQYPQCDFGPGSFEAWVDSDIIYLKDTAGEVLIW